MLPRIRRQGGGVLMTMRRTELVVRCPEVA
jgi:hypothetical protein